MSLLLSILSLIVLLPNTVNAAITATSLTKSFAFLGSMTCNFGILGSLSAYASIISGDIPHIGSSSIYVRFPDIKVPVLPRDIELDTSFATEVREIIRPTVLFTGRIISIVATAFKHAAYALYVEYFLKILLCVTIKICVDY